MKSVYLEGPQRVSIKDVPCPVPKDGEALLRIHAAGICGSDIGAYRGQNKLVTYPRVLGHELGAEVLSLPANYNGPLRTGDRVAVDPYLYCGHCYPCSIGRTNCCDTLRCLGVHVDGGMSEFFCHPASMLVKAPDDMDWELISLAEPLTIALHCIHRLRLKAGEILAIFGAGPIGLLAAMTALQYGAVPILIDPLDSRLKLGCKIGVQHLINPAKEDLLKAVTCCTDGMLCQCVLEASGANQAIRSSLEIVCHAGRIAFTGWPHEETLLPTDLFTKKELDLLGARTSAGEFEEALGLLYSGAVKGGDIVSAFVDADHAVDAIKALNEKPEEYVKVIVRY